MRFVPVDRFASVHEASAEPLLGDSRNNLLPAGAFVLVYGDGGAGKTTLLIDLAFHMATGEEWLGVAVARPCNVLMVENEGPRGNLREKLKAKLDAWTGPEIGDRLRVLEDPWAQFTFADGMSRSELAQAVQIHGADVLVIGPVQTLGVEGGGTPAEVNDFVSLVEEMRREVGRPLAVILVHHQNRAGQVSGAWERVPDTLMHVSAQGNGKTRLFWQKARWASDLHGAAWYLRWVDGEGFELEDRPEVTVDSITADVLTAVAENGGASWTEIRKDVRGNGTEAAKVRDRLLAVGEIVNTAAREGHFNLWLPDDPASDRSGQGTGLERLTDATPARGAETDPFHRSRPIGNGERERNGAPGSNGAGTPTDDDLDRLAELGQELGLA